MLWLTSSSPKISKLRIFSDEVGKTDMLVGKLPRSALQAA
jgi:hypothetical protein